MGAACGSGVPTPRLPDINSAFMRDRGELLNSLRTGDPEFALMAFHALNAMLPPETGKDGLPKYRVIISDQLYREKHGHKIVVICPRCGATHSHSDANIRDVRQSAEAQILGAPPKAKMWTCRPESLLREKQRKGQPAPKACGAENRLGASRVQDRHPSEPFYAGVVYSPPVRPPGIAGRTLYQARFRRWAAIAYAEFEGQSAYYRDSNWTRPDEDGAMGAEMGAIFGANLEAESAATGEEDETDKALLAEVEAADAAKAKEKAAKAKAADAAEGPDTAETEDAVDAAEGPDTAETKDAEAGEDPEDGADPEDAEAGEDPEDGADPEDAEAGEDPEDGADPEDAEAGEGEEAA